MAKKTLPPARAVPQATLSSSQICKEDKSLTVERGWNDHLFLDQCPKYIVLATSSKKLYCLGVDVTPAY